jgi:hypothetical protein
MGQFQRLSRPILTTYHPDTANDRQVWMYESVVRAMRKTLQSSPDCGYSGSEYTNESMATPMGGGRVWRSVRLAGRSLADGLEAVARRLGYYDHWTSLTPTFPCIALHEKHVTWVSSKQKERNYTIKFSMLQDAWMTSIYVTFKSRLSHGSGGFSRRPPRSRPGRSTCNFWWTQCHWHRFLYHFIGFPCQYHSTVVHHSHIFPGGRTMGPMVDVVQRNRLIPLRRSATSFK